MKALETVQCSISFDQRRSKQIEWLKTIHKEVKVVGLFKNVRLKNPNNRRNTMKNRKYAENEINDFIETAQEMGIGPAIRHLGYPRWPTAQKWFEQRGIALPTVDSLQARAAEMKYFYSDVEKKYAVQRNIEAIVESLETKEHDADGINKLSNALHKAIQTMNLIEGKATTVQESRTKDATDLAIADMLNEAKAKNALKEQEISSTEA